MCVSQKILNTALYTSSKSDYKKHPMGCVIFKGSKVISKGYNFVCANGTMTMHAEAHALEQLIRRHGLLRNFRKTLSSLKTDSSKPCRKGGSIQTSSG
jgi:tRNA(Arg) A34 adenosine deaminase TadA